MPTSPTSASRPSNSRRTWSPRQERTEELTDDYEAGPHRGRSDPRRPDRRGRSAPRGGVRAPDAGAGRQAPRRPEPVQRRHRWGGGGGGTTTTGGGGSESGGGETYAAAPAVSSRSGIAISAAMGQQGVPYRYAASSPGEAFDCSGLTAYAWAPGRRRPAAPVASPVRVGSPRVAGRGPARRSAVLLQPDQPRRHLPRWRPAGPRAEHRIVGEGVSGQLGQGHRRRPTWLTRRADAPDHWTRRSNGYRPSPCSQRSTESTATASPRGSSTTSTGRSAPFEFTIIAGGRSNLTFTVTDANGTRFVLRRPPTGAVLATAHDMAREHRIIAAVGTTNVPVPPALGLCTDESVNGAPFYVMGYVDGVVLDSPDRAARCRWSTVGRRACISSTCSPTCTPSTSTKSAWATSPSVRDTSSGR